MSSNAPLDPEYEGDDAYNGTLVRHLLDKTYLSNICSECEGLFTSGHRLSRTVSNQTNVWDRTWSSITTSAGDCFLCSRLTQNRSTFLAKQGQTSRALPNQDTIIYRIYPLDWGIRIEFLAKEMERERFSLVPASEYYIKTEAPQQSSDNSYNAALRKAAPWVSVCDEFHTCINAEACEPSWYPSRIIDVGTTTAPPSIDCKNPNIHTRLCITEDEALSGPYITLSHMWGKNPIITLTDDNIEEFVKEIPFSSLSQTFKDAVIIARGLGIRYLWIDSLCIIRSGPNSKADWQKEVELMRNVYSNAYCNIGSTGAQDNTSGFHLARNPIDAQFPILDVKFQKILSRPYEGTCILIPDVIWTEEDALPLLDRAWVFQERMLCPRMIHFAKDRLFWECKSAFHVEGIPFDSDIQFRWLRLAAHTMQTADHNQYSTASTLANSVNLKSVINTARRKSNIWCKMFVEIYTTNAITVKSDVFPALTGICQMHYKEHRHENDRYLAGLWLNDLPEAMTWYYEPHHRAPAADIASEIAEYIAPSWSWAAAFKPVRHLVTSKVTRSSRVKLLGYELKLRGANPYGGVQFASLTYEGRLERMRFVEERGKEHFVGTHVDNKLGLKEPKEYGSPYFKWAYYPDQVPEFTYGEVLCLTLIRDSVDILDPATFVWGITVAKVPNLQADVYVRTGAWTGYLPMFRRKTPRKQQITII